MLAPGSAVVVDRVSQEVLAGARAIGLRARVLPGISSIETVLAAMEHDASAGVQVVLAQTLVLEQRKLDRTIAAIVLQPAYYDTLFFAGAPRSREGRFDLLAERLGASWSERAPMALVITPSEPGTDPSVFWLRLARLPRLHAAISPRHTLFIPPEREAPRDAAFASRIASWDELLPRIDLDPAGRVRQQSREAAFGTLEVATDLRAESAELAETWRTRAR